MINYTVHTNDSNNQNVTEDIDNTTYNDIYNDINLYKNLYKALLASMMCMSWIINSLDVYVFLLTSFSVVLILFL